jgi:hypothetical protein
MVVGKLRLKDQIENIARRDFVRRWPRANALVVV